MEGIWWDLRYGARVLTRRVRLSALVIFVLGLGLGGSTAMFSLVHHVLVEPLDYEDADRLVAIFRHDRDLGQRRNPTSPADFLDWKRESDTLEHVTAARPWAASLTGRESPTPIPGLKASVSLFSLLGARPALGRVFAPDEGRSGDARVVVLSHALWERQFGSDPDIVGENVILDGEEFAIIGVMPAGFAFPPFWASEAEFWAPLVLEGDEASNRRSQYLRVFARLGSGRRLAEARAELSAIAARLETTYPDTNRNASVSVESLKEPVVGPARPALLLLFGAVGLLLLVACANVAHLLLADASARRSEIAMRLALGAGRMRLLRSFLAESALLTFGGGLTGLAVARWGLSGLRALGGDTIPRLAGVTLDARVFGFAFALTLFTGLLFGVAPSLAAFRTSLVAGLPSRARRDRASRVLVIAEVGMALVLLVGAGLLIRSFHALNQLDPGFAREHLLTMDVALAGTAHEAPERQLQLFERIQDGVEALPGVDAAAFVNHLPIGGDIWQTPFVPEGSESLEPAPRASYRTASEDFFATVGATIERGRGFDGRDRRGSAPVVVVNRTLADRYFAGRDPIGRRLRRGSDTDAAWLTIVGVVSDLRQWSLKDEVRPEIYFPYSQNPTSWWTSATLVVRSRSELSTLVRSVSERVWGVDPNLPLAAPRTMESILDEDVRAPRLQTWILSLFAANAILLAAVGIYGVVAHSVSRRRHELGIRTALGATPKSLVTLVVREGASMTFIGAAWGLAAALVASRFLSSLLFGVDATDPATFAAVAAFLVAVGLVASFVPARRASALAPAAVLRKD